MSQVSILKKHNNLSLDTGNKPNIRFLPELNKTPHAPPILVQTQFETARNFGFGIGMKSGMNRNSSINTSMGLMIGNAKDTADMIRKSHNFATISVYNEDGKKLQVKDKLNNRYD